MGAWVTGTTQGISSKNAAKDLSRANKELTRRMDLAGLDYEARRPQAAADRMRALRNQLSAFSPLNSLVGDMGGGKYSLDLAKLGESPLGMEALPSQLNPLGKGGKIDYQGRGLDPKAAAPGSSWALTHPDDARAVLEDRARSQGYNVPSKK